MSELILSDNGGVNAVHHGYKTLKSKISQMIHFKAQCGLKLVKALIIVAELNSGTYENNYIFQISQWVFVSQLNCMATCFTCRSGLNLHCYIYI